MSAGCEDYSNSNRCPICGGPDWCTYIPQPDGGTKHVCMRVHDYRKGDAFVSNVDQKEYVCRGETKGGNLYFYSKADDDAWRKEHVKGFGKSKQRRVKTKAAPAPKVERKEPETKALPDDKLHYIYSVMLQFLKLEDADREYLHREGFSDELIEKYMLRTLPPEDEYRLRNPGKCRSINPLRRDIAKAVAERFGGDLTGVPGFYQEADENGNLIWQINGVGGIIFPLFDTYENMHRLRIRVSDDILNAAKAKGIKMGKYFNFSSESKKVGGERIYLKNGCSAGNNCGLYCNEGDDFRVVFITEGEKKSIIANEYFQKPFISLPGVNSHSKLLDIVNSTENVDQKRFIDFLKEKGTQLVIVAFDADKIVNDAVLKHEEQTFRRLKEEGFTIGCAEWDMAYGKGIDDLLRGGHTPTFRFVGW